MSDPFGQISGSTAVNLSRLPFPAVIETLDYDALVATLKAQLIAMVPAVAEALRLPSEPLTKLIELFAYREMILRARVNSGARDLTLAYASGSNLDNLVALLGIERLVIAPADPLTGAPETLESDDDLRRRAILAPEGFSVAGPEGAYIFHALSAHPDVADASATSPAPGQVLVTVLSREPGGVPSADVLQAVTDAVSADDVRPLTDQVLVAAAAIVPFSVEASLTLFSGPDAGLVLDEARARLDAHLADSFRLGRDVTRSAIIAALHAEGVQNVALIAPIADLPVSALQAALATGVTLAAGGMPA